MEPQNNWIFAVVIGIHLGAHNKVYCATNSPFRLIICRLNALFRKFNDKSWTFYNVPHSQIKKYEQLEMKQ